MSMNPIKNKLGLASSYACQNPDQEFTLKLAHNLYVQRTCKTPYPTQYSLWYQITKILIYFDDFCIINKNLSVNVLDICLVYVNRYLPKSWTVVKANGIDDWVLYDNRSNSEDSESYFVLNNMAFNVETGDIFYLKNTGEYVSSNIEPISFGN